MSSKTLLAGCGCIFAASLMGTSAVAAPQVFAYEGAGCTGAGALPALEKMLGRKVDGVTDFVARDNWADAQQEMSWALGCWKGKGYKLQLAVPMVTNDLDGPTALASGSTGGYNAQFTQMAKTLVANGFADAYIRIGWEFNGGWFKWAASSSPTKWKAYYRQIVGAMRAVNGANFKFVWNPNIGSQQVSPDLAYPGDDVVDIVGLDAYNASWVSGYTVAATRWNDILNQTWGLAQTAAFAKSHGKPVALPEWGTGSRSDGHGGGDDPLYVTNMGSWLTGASAAYASYWDYAQSDYNAKLSNGQSPNAAAAYVKAFGGAAVAPLTASASRGASVVVANNPDGSAILTVKFPKTSSTTHYTIWLSQPRQVETWGRMPQIGWDAAGGVATIHVGAS